MQQVEQEEGVVLWQLPVGFVFGGMRAAECDLIAKGQRILIIQGSYNLLKVIES